jgi:hypothetical protein
MAPKAVRGLRPDSGEERMETVFSTDTIAPEKRYASWRDAICDVYVHVDVKATDPENYKGYIRENVLGMSF